MNNQDERDPEEEAWNRNLLETGDGEDPGPVPTGLMNLWPSKLTMSWHDVGDQAYLELLAVEDYPSPVELICSAMSELLFRCEFAEQEMQMILWSPSPDGSTVTVRADRPFIEHIEQTRRGSGFDVMSVSHAPA